MDTDRLFKKVLPNQMMLKNKYFGQNIYKKSVSYLNRPIHIHLENIEKYQIVNSLMNN